MRCFSLAQWDQSALLRRLCKGQVVGALWSVERRAVSFLYRQHGLEDPVCIVDLGEVARLFRDWMAAMPRVVPFYAVKANNDEAIIALLAALGAGFDCASDAEVCTLCACCTVKPVALHAHQSPQS